MSKRKDHDEVFLRIADALEKLADRAKYPIVINQTIPPVTPQTNWPNTFTWPGNTATPPGNYPYVNLCQSDQTSPNANPIGVQAYNNSATPFTNISVSLS